MGKAEWKETWAVKQVLCRKIPVRAVAPRGCIGVEGAGLNLWISLNCCLISAVNGSKQRSVLVNKDHIWSQHREAKKMKLLTVQEVADTIKVSESTVRRLIRRGQIAAFKVGDRGQLRVKEHDLERYVESQRVKVENTEIPQKESSRLDK